MSSESDAVVTVSRWSYSVEFASTPGAAAERAAVLSYLAATMDSRFRGDMTREARGRCVPQAPVRNARRHLVLEGWRAGAFAGAMPSSVAGPVWLLASACAMLACSDARQA